MYGIETVNLAVTQAMSTGLVMQTANMDGAGSRYLSIEGRTLLNFGSCSYLGLERRPELSAEVVRVLGEFGTQFSYSRAYLQSEPYVELERNLNEIAGGYVLVAGSTTLGHLSALPVLVCTNDCLVVDQFAHSSLQMAIGLVHGVRPVVLRHSRIERLREIAERAKRSRQRVWYVCDGVYSMHGDIAPFDALAELLESSHNLHLYIDDAHATSWSGKNGRGLALEHFAGHDRVVIALSLNKAFSAAGGALVFPSSKEYWNVRKCGGPMLFSGPIQPPMLGAALASSRLHLQPEFVDLQSAELERIRLTHHLAARHGIPLGSWDETPIFFVPCGAESTAFELVGHLREKGFYLCPSTFPVVPRRRAGARFTISLHNTTGDIEEFMNELGEQVRRLALSNGNPKSGTVQVGSKS